MTDQKSTTITHSECAKLVAEFRAKHPHAESVATELVKWLSSSEYFDVINKYDRKNMVSYIHDLMKLMRAVESLK